MLPREDGTGESEGPCNLRELCTQESRRPSLCWSPVLQLPQALFPLSLHRILGSTSQLSVEKARFGVVHHIVCGHTACIWPQALPHSFCYSIFPTKLLALLSIPHTQDLTRFKYWVYYIPFKNERNYMNLSPNLFLRTFERWGT